MIERNERKAYWRHTKAQMLTSLLPFVLALIVLPLYADALNDKRILGIPLGYFLACHGLSSSPSSRWPCSSTARMRSTTGTARTKTSERHGLHRAHPARQSAARHLLRHLHGGLRGAGADGADVRAARHRRLRRAARSCSPGPSRSTRPSACCPRRARRSDYFACGRRVPAFFNGLVLAISALGGAGFLALTGAFFSVGFDALCLSLGWSAPASFSWACCWRRSCASSAPTRCRRYLGRRFESRTLRVVAAAVLAVPLLLLLAAEARFAAYASAWLTRPIRAPDGGRSSWPASRRSIIAGGMRSLTWSSVGQGHRRAAGARGAGHHRRHHDVQPAAAADDARQRAAHAHAHRGRARRADLPGPDAGASTFRARASSRWPSASSSPSAASAAWRSCS